MNREQSVSWAGAEYHTNHIRCRYALVKFNSRCLHIAADHCRSGPAPVTVMHQEIGVVYDWLSLWLCSAYDTPRPKQTYIGLIYAVLPLSPTHIRPVSDCSRSVWSVLLTTLHRPTAKWGHVPEGRVRHTKLSSNLLSLEMCHLHIAWHQTTMRLKARFSTRFNP